MQAVVRTFLRTGKTPTGRTQEIASVCNEYIRGEGQRSPRRAVDLARKFVSRTRKLGGANLSSALRTLGWACRLDNRFAESAEAYLEARSLYRRDPLWRARIDRILIDIYMYLGQRSESRRRMRLAIAAFDKLGRKDEIAKTQVNWANVLHRQDRHREAHRTYEKASRFFQGRSERLSLALCYYNEANTLVQLMKFDGAAERYRTAGEIFSQHNHDLFALECRYGEAWLYMLTGDYHEALRRLAECERDYRSRSQHRGVMLCNLDRAEAFLGLNLYTDARHAARRAYRRARRLGTAYEAAKASFYIGKAALATGDRHGARLALTGAARDFRQEKNKPFLAAVQLTVNALQNGCHSPKELNAVRKKLEQAQLPLLEAVCDLQSVADEPDLSDSWHRLRYNRAVRTVPHLYAQYQTLLGDRAACKGNQSGARRHWMRAVEALDAVRAQLPPVDLRATFLRQRTDPYRRLIRADLDRDPSRSAAWSERLQCAGLWTLPPLNEKNSKLRNEAIDSLAELARRVTAISSRLSGEPGQRSVGFSGSPFRELEDRIRLALSSLDAASPAEVGQTEQLQEEFKTLSRKLPVVQFTHDGDDLIALVHETGATRSRVYIDGKKRLSQMVGCWQLIMSRAMTDRGRRRSGDQQEESDLFAQLGDWLWSPLELSARHKRVLIMPDSRLTNLPWAAIIADGAALCERHDLIISPSLRHYQRAGKIRVQSNKVELLVGRSNDLRGVDSELDLFANIDDRRLTVHNPCRRRDWPDRSSAELWHYTGHAMLRSDNPFYSSLLLDDGPLYAADFRLKRCRVNLVTLAACRTGQQVYLPGEEMTGLVRALLEMGARSVLAGLWAVSDETASLWMHEFYRNYFEGRSIGHAYRSAAMTVRGQYPSAYHWAAFAVYGAG